MMGAGDITASGVKVSLKERARCRTWEAEFEVGVSPGHDVI